MTTGSRSGLNKPGERDRSKAGLAAKRARVKQEAAAEAKAWAEEQAAARAKATKAKGRPKRKARARVQVKTEQEAPASPSTLPPPSPLRAMQIECFKTGWAACLEVIGRKYHLPTEFTELRQEQRDIELSRWLQSV